MHKYLHLYLMIVILIIFGACQQKDSAHVVHEASKAIKEDRKEDAIRLLKTIKQRDQSYKFAQEILYGLTDGREGKRPKTVGSITNSVKREIIGKWLDGTPGIGSTIEIYQQEGKYYIVYYLFQGGKSKQEITMEYKSGERTYFRRVDYPSDYYIITEDNYLESRDRMGLIFTARPIR